MDLINLAVVNKKQILECVVLAQTVPNLGVKSHIFQKSWFVLPQKPADWNSYSIQSLS